MKTDNSYFVEKVLLRVMHLPEKKNINILDCYAGYGLIWDAVKKNTDKNINVLYIEKDEKKCSIGYLQGDNIKYLQGMDLDKYDIIDLDAYGIPYKQLKIILDKNYKGIIFVTSIQTMFGQLPFKLLYSNGYSEEMIKKCPSLFNKKGIEKVFNYLYIKGLRQVTGYFLNGKNYFVLQNKEV